MTDTYWPVAGVDLSLLVSAGIALWAARKLALRQRGLVNAPAEAPNPDATEVAHV